MVRCASNVESTRFVYATTHTLIFHDSFWFSIRYLFRVNEKFICHLCQLLDYAPIIRVARISVYLFPTLVHWNTQQNQSCSLCIHSRAYIHPNKHNQCATAIEYSLILAHREKHTNLLARSNRWVFIHSTYKQIQCFSFPNDFFTCASSTVWHILWFEY